MPQPSPLDWAPERGDFVQSGVTRFNDAMNAWRPTGFFAENYPRTFSVATDLTLTSGSLHVIAGPKLLAGDVISSFTLNVGSQGSVGLTHSWFCLIDPITLAISCKTADDTGAWNSFGLRAVSMATPFTVPYNQVPYIGVLITAGTLPTPRGVNCNLSAAPPFLSAESTTGLTTPASLGATAAALNTATGVIPWVGLS